MGDALFVANGNGIQFEFFFERKPDLEAYVNLSGQEVNNSDNVYPRIRVGMNVNGTEIHADNTTNSDDNLRFDQVIIVTDDEALWGNEDIGKIFAIRGTLHLKEEDIEIDGDFMIKVFEVL